MKPLVRNPLRLMLVLLLLGGGPALANDDATPAEIARVRYELSKVEQKLKDADGQQIELSKYDRKAFTQVKELAERYPKGARVAKLVEEAKKLYRAAKGVTKEITPEMLAYRQRGKRLAEAVAKAASEEWDELKLDATTSDAFIEKPLPTKMPPEVDGDEMIGSTVIFENVPYEQALFVQSGVNWIPVGQPSRGFYWVIGSGRPFDAMYEALRRYRSKIQQTIPDQWTILGEIVGADVLAPESKKKGQTRTFMGWVVKPTAIYVPGTVLLIEDETSEDGARFAGEERLRELISYSVTSVPENVEPKQLLEIYITALKEKNWELHLECIDPEQRKHTAQRQTLQYTWAVQQKGLERSHAHAEVAEVGEIRVTRGYVDEDLEDFFGDENAKKPKVPQEKEERVRVSVRLYDEHGRQTVRQRHVTLIRRNGGRWYIYGGMTLTF